MYILLIRIYEVLMRIHKFFWRYNDVEYNQDPIRSQKGYLFLS